jgi:hypothetical protein
MHGGDVMSEVDSRGVIGGSVAGWREGVFVIGVGPFCCALSRAQKE